MVTISYCPIVGGRCNKGELETKVLMNTFFLAEPFKPETERRRREQAVRTALREALKDRFSDISLRLADKEPKEAIFCDICRLIQSSACGIADISGSNPNVLLELGMLLSLGKPVFVLVKKSEEESLREKLPSDILWKRVIPYEEFVDVEEELSKQILNGPKVEPELSLGEKAKEVFTQVDPHFAQTIETRLQELKREQKEGLGRLERLLKDAKISEKISTGMKVEVPPSLEKQIDKLSHKTSSIEKLVGFSEDPEVAFLEGNWNLRQKKYDRALNLFDRALTLKPDFSGALVNKGYVLNERGKYEEALACFDKAIKIKPDLQSAWINKGFSISHLGKYEEAIACYDKAIKIKPDNVIAWNNKGEVLAHLGRWEEAEYWIKKSLRKDPNFIVALENFSEFLLISGDLAKGLETAEKALNLSEKAEENKAIPWFLCISAYFFMGEMEKAQHEIANLINHLRGLKERLKVIRWDFSLFMPTIEKRLEGKSKKKLLSLISLLKGEIALEDFLKKEKRYNGFI